MPCRPFPIPYQGFLIPFRQIRLEGAPVGGLPGARRAPCDLPYMDLVSTIPISEQPRCCVNLPMDKGSPHLFIPPLICLPFSAWPQTTNDSFYAVVLSGSGTEEESVYHYHWTFRYVIDPSRVRSLTPCGKICPPLVHQILYSSCI